MFPNDFGSGPIDPKNWYRRVFKQALEDAARDEHDPILGFGFHDLRHTTATRLRQRGVPLEDVAEALTHADTRVTQRYAHIAPGHLDDVVERLCEASTATATATEPPESTSPETPRQANAPQAAGNAA